MAAHKSSVEKTILLLTVRSRAGSKVCCRCQRHAVLDVVCHALLLGIARRACLPLDFNVKEGGLS